MILLGANHFNECPIQPYIPIYLIIIGGCGLVLLMLVYWENTLHEGFWKQICIVLILCIIVFSLIWFITGKKKTKRSEMKEGWLPKHWSGKLKTQLLNSGILISD